jgi:redox-sensing transcriptional repressor
LEKISEFTIRRLSTYYRLLGELGKNATETVSSSTLANLGGFTSAQVRKDLSCFGSFGTRGLGYEVRSLTLEIKKILGLNRDWSLALFGAGSLGHALFFFPGFREDGFVFKHVFDTDPEKTGIRWEQIEIAPFERARERLLESPVDIGVIATPKEAAQDVADLLTGLGVRGVLNFAPTDLSVPGGVMPRNVNLAVAMESLSFFLSS